MTRLSRYYFCLTGMLMAEELRVGAELWRLRFCLSNPHSHSALPPVKPCKARAVSAAHSREPTVLRTWSACVVDVP